MALSFYQHIPNHLAQPNGHTVNSAFYVYTAVHAQLSQLCESPLLTCPEDMQVQHPWAQHHHSSSSFFFPHASSSWEGRPHRGGRTREHKMIESQCIIGQTLPLTTPHPPFPHGHLLFKSLLVVQFGPGVSKMPPHWICTAHNVCVHTWYDVQQMGRVVTTQCSSAECYHFAAHHFTLIFYILATVHSMHTVHVHSYRLLHLAHYTMKQESTYEAMYVSLHRKSQLNLSASPRHSPELNYEGLHVLSHYSTTNSQQTHFSPWSFLTFSL